MHMVGCVFDGDFREEFGDQRSRTMKTHVRLFLLLVPLLFVGLKADPAPLPQVGQKDQPKDAEPKPGSIFGRTSRYIEKALREGGGNLQSEAAVVRGLKWLKRNQSVDGSWKLDGNF